MKRDGKVEKEPEDKKRCGGGAIFFFLQIREVLKMEGRRDI